MNPNEFLIRNKSQIEKYNTIRSEVKHLIEDNSDYHLKNIYYDGVCHSVDDDPEVFGWFVILIEHSVSLELVQLLHNYFGGNCIISEAIGIGNDGFTVIFEYDEIKYVKQNYEDETIKWAGEINER